MPVQKIGDVFNVNTSTAGTQFAPAISALDNGGFVVAWDFVGSSIVGQLYDDQAFRSGGEFVISTTNNNAQFAPDIATLTDGTFVVTWAHEFSATDIDVRARRFSEDGVGFGTDFGIAVTGARDETLPSITAQLNGRYLTTWSQDDNVVNFVQHDANGNVLSGPGPIDAAPSANNERFSSVTALVDGTYVVAFEQGEDIFQRRLVAGANAEMTHFNVDGVQSRPSIAPLENGGYITIWNDRNLFAGSQRYDSLGNKAGPQQVLSQQTFDSGNLDQTTPAILGLVGGGYLSVWDGIGGLRAQARNADGTINANSIQLTPEGSGGSLGELDVTQMKNGDVIVVWGGSDGDGVGIQGQVLRVFNTVNGTTGDDRLATALTGAVSNLNPGFQANDILNGFAGNDALQGLGGAQDILDGGEGIDTASYIDAPSPVAANLLIPRFNNGDAIGDSYISIENLEGSFFGDQLTGNNAVNAIDGYDGNDFIEGLGGNDFLIGGDGGDALEGGSGNDIYRLNDVFAGSFDSVTEAPNAGVDTVRVNSAAGLSGYSLGANVENGQILGVSAFNLGGNNLANLLTGNLAANGLSGLGGIDLLQGMGGNDILSGGPANDLLIGGLGKDTMRGDTDIDTFRFLATTDSVVGINADSILDFDDSGNDRIDVSALFGAAMTYRHSAAFTAAGQVRINDVLGADVVVEVNTGGSLAADFSIRLTNTTLDSMTASDFVL